MIRQLIVSLLVVGAAALAWLFFVPSAPQTLAAYGITLPFVPSAGATETQARAGTGSGGPGARSGGGSGQAGDAGRPGGGGARQNNVVTTDVTMARINDTLTAIGEGTAERSVTVSAPAGGTLTEILVRPGQVVQTGAVLARLQADEQQIAFDQAQLAANDARETLTRTEGLASSNLVATTALAAAQLAADNAELSLRNAQIALEARTISSPIDGTVGLLQVQPGNYVAAQTAVTTVDDNSAITVDFWVPERYSSQLTAGMPVMVNAIALPGEQFDGTISAVDNRIDAASRTLQVQAQIPNTDGRLRAGMSFSVAVAFPGETFPAVNPLAILWSAEGSYVWQYVDGKAKKTLAEIIQRNSDGVLVRSDLAPGDAIITEGILQLSDGASVTLLSGPDGTGAGAATTAEATPPAAS